MSKERMVQHGLIGRLRVRYELCSVEADVHGKDIVWVPESLAAEQNRILGEYERFHEALASYQSSRSRAERMQQPVSPASPGHS